jgi:hypothetical protein
MQPSETPRAKLAHKLVAEARKAGTLLRGPCEVCGDPWAVAHHDDYNKPLAVRWLCFHHHMRHHAALRPRQPRAVEALLTYNGETLTVAAWANRVGLQPMTLYGRIFRLHWPAVIAFALRPCAHQRFAARVGNLVRAARECLAYLGPEEARQSIAETLFRGKG